MYSVSYTIFVKEFYYFIMRYGIRQMPDYENKESKNREENREDII